MFKPINVNKKFQVLDKKKKLEAINKVFKAIEKKDPWAFEYYSEQVKDTFQFALKYYPRLNLFRSSSRKLVFNPETGLANSYDWYNIAQVINGKMILNTFRYSVTTSKHVWELKSLFRQLGIKYQTIEAPRGLQDLSQAMRCHTFNLAKLMIEHKYGRNSRMDSIKHEKRKIKLIESISNQFVKFDEELLNRSLNEGETDRANRLARKREERNAA